MRSSVYPKISIVTPSYNQGEYLEQTILSIINQDYPNLEYIIIDGGSTDNSIDIIKKYEHKLSYWVSEPDGGMYEALQKGFEKTTGEFMGWLNSDDMLHKNSLFLICEILQLNLVEWIQGRPTSFDEMGRIFYTSSLQKWSKYRYLLHDYNWIQQESTFWTRKLWNKAGGYISGEYKYAGDMELWNRFFKYEKLYTLSCLIGGFRNRVNNQLSLDHMGEYLEEAKAILNRNKLSIEEEQIIKKIKRANLYLKYLRKSRIFNLFFITSRLKARKKKLYDFPPDILFIRDKQKFSL